MHKFYTRKRMWVLWLQLAVTSTVSIAYILLTVVFCFWFVYLVDAMKRKRSFYKTIQRCVQEKSDLYQQMLAYNAKTQLVKFVSLFCLNLVEWVGGTFAAISLVLEFVVDYQKFSSNHSLSLTKEPHTKLNIPYIDNVCVINSMTIIGSLCMYLSARYSQMSWIKSNSIPYWSCFFFSGSIATQILITICYTQIIGRWCDVILVTLSVIFAWKQYRKLNMVLQWSIVDLRVKGDIELLDRHVRMKRRFNRIFTAIWIGISCIIMSEYIKVLSRTAHTLGMSNNSFTEMLLCETAVDYDSDSYVSVLLNYMEDSLSILGSLFIFIPYVGYGLCTMYVLLWRLFRGKTGYRTHFHVQLKVPLI